MRFLRCSLTSAVVVLCGCGDNTGVGEPGQPGPADDDVMLVVSPQADLRTTESGGTATVAFVLSGSPRDEVVIDLASMNTSEGTVSPSSLTFDRDNYDQPHEVTLTGVDDDRADGDVPYSVRAMSLETGMIDLEVTNQDDDTAGFVVSPLSGLSTSESGTTATFQVHLTSQPTADVMVPVASADASEGATDLGALTFTPANWSTPQIVTVTGQQDDIFDGLVDYDVVLSAATSADTDYQGLDAADVTLLSVDDDVLGIAVVAPAGFATNEAGTPATFSVVLQTQPAADVTIDVTTSDASEASTTTTQLVFTPSDWNQAQSVTVTGVDDFVDDDDQAFTVVLAAATSTDAMYNGFDPDDVAGVNADNDTAGIVVTPAGGLATSEGGQVDAFDVVLSAQPTEDVTIAVATSDATEGTTTTASLTFTAGNWDQPQAVAVIGVDDPTADGNQPYTVVLSPATSNDTTYSGMKATDVTVMNEDNDIAGVSVDLVDGLVVSEFTDTDTFTVVLNTQPTADVTISLTSSDTSEGTVSPSSVTFTPLNWDVPKTVTVTGVNDAAVDGNVLFSIVTGATASSDPAYSGLAVADVEVTNIDDDTAQVYVKARKRLRTSESGQSSTFRVRLTIAPTATVTCTLSSNDTSEGVVSPQTLVFQPNQFNFQTVTVEGVDDQLVDGDVLYTIVLDACTSADPQYSGDDPRDVTVINRDND